MTDAKTTVSNRYVYAAMIVCLTMMPSLLWMPSLLGLLHDGYGLGANDLSQLAFAELGGFLTSTLFSSGKTIAQLKRWVLIGCVVLVVVNGALLSLGSALPLIVARPIAGLAAGLGFGYVLKLCGASANPTRGFGILTAAMSMVMIIGFQTVAHLVDGVTGVEAIRHVAGLVFGIYAAMAIVAAIILLTNSPPQSPEAGSAAAGPGGLPSPTVIIGLVAILLSFMGQGGVWVFLQTLGVAHGFSVAGVANAMSAFAILGIVGSLVAAAVPQNVPRSLLIGSALLVLMGGFYALYAPASLVWYIVGCSIGGFYWNFILPLMLGLLARVDPTGRGSVLGGSMSSAGGAVGPLLAGALVQGSNYQPVGWMAAGMCIAGLICVAIVERRSA